MTQEEIQRKLNIDRIQAKREDEMQRIEKQKQGGRIRKNNSVENIARAKKAMSGSKVLMPVRAASLALKMRRDNKEEIDESAYAMAFFFAFIADFADFIPVAGPIISLFIKPFLFVFLWGKGSWKVKVVRFVLIGLDCLPVSNKVPWSMICVAYSYSQEKKQLKKSIVYF